MVSAAREILANLDAFLTENIARLMRPQGFDDAIFADLHKVGLYRLFIPAQHGGCYVDMTTALQGARLVSYHSVELGLAVGLTASLFLLPMGRHAAPELQAEVFPDYLARSCVAGMLATEPGFGTDMTGIQTSFEPEGEGHYRVRGLKHWQGLSGRAEYWLVMARKRRPDTGEMTRDMDFFVMKAPTEGAVLEEKFPSTGLLGIPYGRTRLDVLLPARWKLSGARSNLRAFYDIMHRSRICVAGLAAGMCERLAKEIDAYVSTRSVFGKALGDYEQARYRQREIQVCASICDWLVRFAGYSLEADKSGLFDGFISNAVKALSTDLMQNASHSAVQLRGAEGFRRDNYIGRSFVDCRPYQIFEGSNDVLYDAVTSQYQGEIKKYGWTSVRALFEFRNLPVPAQADLDAIIPADDPVLANQVGRVALGKQLSYLVGMSLRQMPLAQEAGHDAARLDASVEYLRMLSTTARINAIDGARWYSS